MSFDKTVKNACKAKKDPPKAKVRAQIVSSSFFQVLIRSCPMLLLLLLLGLVMVLSTPTRLPRRIASPALLNNAHPPETPDAGNST